MFKYNVIYKSVMVSVLMKAITKNGKQGNGFSRNIY